MNAVLEAHSLKTGLEGENMTPLRKRMEEDMRLHKLSDRTREQYINCVDVYARHYGASPEHLGEHEVRGFLLLLAEMGRKASTLVVYHAALKPVHAAPPRGHGGCAQTTSPSRPCPPAAHP